MSYSKPIKVLGMGKYLPECMPSEVIELQNGLPAGWSETNSGVASRHRTTFESNAYMGARAAENALSKCGLELADVDMLISAAATYDYPIPNSASMIKSEIKDGVASTIPAIDINSTCLSFVTAFEFAASLLNGKQYRRILIVSSEIASIGLNTENWEVLTLFGDGAAAAILEYDEETDSQFIKGVNMNFCEGVADTMLKGGGSRNWYQDYSPTLHSFSMNGRNLLRLSLSKLEIFTNSFFENMDITMTDVDVIIPHQASKAGLNLFKKQNNLPNDRVKETLHKYGNCIAASIPLTMHDAIESGELKRGDTCWLIGTSAGFSIGSILIRY